MRFLTGAQGQFVNVQNPGGYCCLTHAMAGATVWSSAIASRLLLLACFTPVPAYVSRQATTKFGPDALGGNQGTYALDRIRGRLLGGESMPSSVTPGFSVVDMATHNAIDHRGEQKIKCRVVCRKYQEPKIFAFRWSID
jgi:hypothetical protein